MERRRSAGAWVRAAVAVMAAAACSGSADVTRELVEAAVQAQNESLAADPCPSNAEVCSGADDVVGSCLQVVGEPALRAEVAQTFRPRNAGYPGKVRLMLKRLLDPPPGADPLLRIELRALVNGKVPLDPASTFALAKIRASELTGADATYAINFTSSTMLDPAQTYAIVLRVESPELLNVGVGCHRSEDFPGGEASTRRLALIAPGLYQNTPFLPTGRDLAFSITENDGCVPGQIFECGVGACYRTVPTCTDGKTNTCVPGAPAPETCNTIDDNCDGQADNPAAAICPRTSNASGTLCVSGGVCTVSSCAAGFYDIDRSYANGCECADDAAATGAACLGNPTSFGTVATGGTKSWDGRLPDPALSDYLAVDVSRAAALSNSFSGTITIDFATNPGDNFRFQVIGSGCANDPNCAASLSSYTFADACNAGRPNDCTTRNQAFASRLLLRVFRTSLSGGACSTYSIRARYN